jgi:hypothetical protein
MYRKSILAKRSPKTTEVKAAIWAQKTLKMVKHFSFVFIFCAFFAACPAFSQEYKLEIKRSFPSSERPEGPPQHGDYSYFKELENGGTVGSLHLFKPREAIFIIWDGEVIAGPLTTVKQVEEAFKILGNELAEAHELRMNIMRRFPTDRKKRYRVYDSKGNLIREDNDY